MARHRTHKSTSEWKLTTIERRARRAAKYATVPLDTVTLMEELSGRRARRHRHELEGVNA